VQRNVKTPKEVVVLPLLRGGDAQRRAAIRISANDGEALHGRVVARRKQRRNWRLKLLPAYYPAGLAYCTPTARQRLGCGLEHSWGCMNAIPSLTGSVAVEGAGAERGEAAPASALPCQ